MTSREWTELAGWYGVVAILAAYALLNVHAIGVDSVSYQALNATGAVGIMVDAWKQKNWQPVALNAVWLAIALISLLRV